LGTPMIIEGSFVRLHWLDSRGGLSQAGSFCAGQFWHPGEGFIRRSGCWPSSWTHP